jgi:hypothetical protein
MYTPIDLSEKAIDVTGKTKLDDHSTLEISKKFTNQVKHVWAEVGRGINFFESFLVKKQPVQKRE